MTPPHRSSQEPLCVSHLLWWSRDPELQRWRQPSGEPVHLAQEDWHRLLSQRHREQSNVGLWRERFVLLSGQEWAWNYCVQLAPHIRWLILFLVAERSTFKIGNTLLEPCPFFLSLSKWCYESILTKLLLEIFCSVFRKKHCWEICSSCHSGCWNTDCDCQCFVEVSKYTYPLTTTDVMHISAANKLHSPNTSESEGRRWVQLRPQRARGKVNRWAPSAWHIYWPTAVLYEQMQEPIWHCPGGDFTISLFPVLGWLRSRVCKCFKRRCDLWPKERWRHWEWSSLQQCIFQAVWPAGGDTVLQAWNAKAPPSGRWSTVQHSEVPSAMSCPTEPWKSLEHSWSETISHVVHFQ